MKGALGFWRDSLLFVGVILIAAILLLGPSALLGWLTGSWAAGIALLVVLTIGLITAAAWDYE